MLEAAATSKHESGIPAKPFVTYDTHPNRYAHWKLSYDGPIATLKMDVDENRGISPGYKLKLNSYDLGVDIELSDALQRIRFEHPEVKSVVVTSGKERVFCSGANIFMLGLSTHAWKVNFCKFTNETRNGIEDSSAHSGLKFIAACNGTTAGGGYELALACDEIILIDDRSSAVSLPEVPLLGVLPGTGGLTRITDKRKVRRDQADIFCTLVEGVRAPRAKEWRLIDDHVKPQLFTQKVRSRALELAAKSDRPHDAEGIALTPLNRNVDDTGYRYEHVDVRINRNARSATITVSAPLLPQPEDLDAILALGASWWPLAMARELDDAILLLRTNELEIGTWLLKTKGDAMLALAIDATLRRNESNWFVRETIGMLRRTLARLDVDDGQLDKAIAPLTEVMNGSKDTELRQIARLRLARILTDQGKADEAIKMLAEPMPAAFAIPYHEVRGDAYLAKKDIPDAVTEYQAALGAAEASGINGALLELKIEDIGAVPAPMAKANSADTQPKAKR